MAAVYASGFDRDTDDDILRKHFGKVGGITDLYFQSNGAAVITFDSAAAADRAVAELNGTTMNGQERYVSVKLDDPERKQASSKGKGKETGKGKGKSKGKSGTSASAAVFASGFDFNTDEFILKKHFGKVGWIEELYFQSNGAAVITYADAASAHRAVAEIDGTTMRGQQRYVSVRLDDPDRKKGSKGAGKGGKTSGKGKDKAEGKAKGKGYGAAVYASGFEYDTDEAVMKKHFGEVGHIKELYFQSRGSAVVTYEEVDAANRAVAELDGSTIEGQQRYVAVHLDVRSKGGKGKSR